MTGQDLTLSAWQVGIAAALLLVNGALSVALGGTRWEAARNAARTAVRAGMTPIINQMSVVGVVSLPGMMTGQVLAASSGLGTVAAVLLAYRRLFSRERLLLVSRIVQRGGAK
ncbi:ABC transporter permease [Ralstonia sp. UBA689]|uniref:ABC transporter permease n=1 Tax=Ralstonia sp. UBA689 TaxID=1947373 RepID=UPI0025D3459A|nr:ABC transporter permease [Ralstonia sp. UBA689]